MMMEYPVLNTREVAANLKRMRKERSITVMQVAEFMGFTSPQAVYKWERGDCMPTLDNIFALSRVFDTTIDILITARREEDESSPLPLFLRAFL